MRRAHAIALLVLFLGLNAFDGLRCPDGCTHDEDPAAEQRTPDGFCALCLGGVDSPPEPGVSDVVSLSRRLPLPVLPSHAEAPPDPPEHPPRGFWLRAA